MFPHGKSEPDEYGHSPGNGITPIPLSRDPIATEGEATPGPDDENPFLDRERRRQERGHRRSTPKAELDDPTEGKDPFVFDEIGAALDDLEPPGLDVGPDLLDPPEPLLKF